MCGVCFAVPAFIINWKTDSSIIAMLVGLPFGFAPIAFVLFKRSSASTSSRRGCRKPAT